MYYDKITKKKNLFNYFKFPKSFVCKMYYNIQIENAYFDPFLLIIFEQCAFS